MLEDVVFARIDIHDSRRGVFEVRWWSFFPERAGKVPPYLRMAKYFQAKDDLHAYQLWDTYVRSRGWETRDGKWARERVKEAKYGKVGSTGRGACQSEAPEGAQPVVEDHAPLSLR